MLLTRRNNTEELMTMRAIKEAALRTELRGWLGSHLTNKKTIFPFVCMLLFGLTFVSFAIYYHIQLGRYEAKINYLRSLSSVNTKQTRQQVQEDIANAIEADRVQSVHHIAKRGAPEDDEVEPIGEVSTGVSYTRWGRRDCPGANTRTLYIGLAAASYYSHSGGGSNYLCLDFNVNYTTGKYQDGNQGSSYIYGVEYRDGSWVNSLFNLQDTTESNSMYLHSVPCAICMALQKVNQVMIPGAGVCPNGWNLEYRGFIMAGSHSDKHPSQFICVDAQPQVVPGTHGDQNGGHLHIVETQCASLLCEPFVTGRELQCVVCSI